MEHTVQGLSMGSVLISSWVAIALSGVMLLQAYMYYRGRRQTDEKIYGFLVVILLLLDVAHVICIMITLYHYLIRSFGNNKELEILVPSLAVSYRGYCTVAKTHLSIHAQLTVGLTGTITFFAQSFFTWRVWKLSQKSIIAPVIFVFQIARLTSGWVTTVKAIEFGTFVAWTHQVRWIFTAGLAVAVLCDILITGSLCYWLHGSRSGVHGMNEIIDKIILYSVENGMLICLASVASLICGITMPGNLIFIGIHFVISKLYINSILASLNTRNSFRARKERLFINARPAGEDGPETLRYRDHNFLSTHGYVLQSPKSPRSFRSSDLAVSVKEAEQTGTSTESDFAVRTEHVV
ncbi:hypothetical protein ACEPAH_6408 [Sanghuangporus vaninii]